MAYTTIDKPSDYMRIQTWSGNNSADREITWTESDNMQPDWIWVKRRSDTANHRLADSVRGATKILRSDTTDAETTESDDTLSFDINGFSVGNNSGVNKTGDTYVGWGWKAGTSVSGNTGGSGTAKTYTGSVNTDAGFSIIRYIGNSTAGHTIPHHLGTTPAWIICRTISAVKEWDVYHHKNTSSPETDYLVLNTTAATTDASDKWNDTAPTSSVVTLGDSSQLNTNDGTCIMYAFAEKKGYSKFGSYTGNNDDDGAFVYTGFKPAFVMVKITAGQTDNWIMQDNKINSFNGASSQRLRPNSSGAEFSSSNEIDLLSNGFKTHGADGEINGSGFSYIYMAFAENPFVNSNGVPTNAR